MKLLDIALKTPGLRTLATPERDEVFVAYLKGEVSARQACTALFKGNPTHHSSSLYSGCVRVARRLLKEGKLRFVK
jgi:hypothetical protein